jgi:hypothetical protein
MGRTSKRLRIVIILLVLLVAVALLAGCRSLLSRRQSVTPPDAEPLTSSLTSPIDGQPISTELMGQRPLAVMVENSPNARPQSGLNEASVVYEAITEGGITRFLAIYSHGVPEIIGPVRSARPHFIHFAREYDAAFVHCGQSQEALEMLVSTPQIYDLDQMKYDKPFWRDRSRRAPHNLYTSADKLRAFVAQKRWSGMPTTLPVFASDRVLKNGEPAETINIDFNGGVKYKLRFVYDAERNGYLRYMDGKLHVDRETNEPVVAKNILVQRVESQQYPGSAHQTYDVSVIGNGEGIFISNGRQLSMEWKKRWSGSITAYTDSRGNSLPFQPGQTWVEVLPLEGKVSISGPSAPAA